jgi:SAM-dependent methyltransferase
VAWVFARVLDEGAPVFAWRARRSLRILESSARGALPMFFGDKFDYFATEYDPIRIAGGKRPREYADFQKLHYPADYFDVVIASDVFEHIRHDDDAMVEVRRVLKPGGYLILTVPYDHERPQTIRRVDTSGSKDVHLLPPQYHGGGGHTLAYREYGRDLINLMSSAGLFVEREVVERPDLGITPQSVFVARKSERVQLPEARPLEAGSTGPMLPFRIFVACKWGARELSRNLGGSNPTYLMKGMRQLMRDARRARR